LKNNVKAEALKLFFKRDEVIDKISETYADVNEGENWHYLILRYLEIAIKQSNAAAFRLTGLLRKTSNSQSQYLNSRCFIRR